MSGESIGFLFALILTWFIAHSIFITTNGLQSEFYR